MAYTGINSEDRLVQATFAKHLEQHSAGKASTPGARRPLGPTAPWAAPARATWCSKRDLRAALARLNPELPAPDVDEAAAVLTHRHHTRTVVQHNQAFHALLRDGLPVRWRDERGQAGQTLVRVIDFADPLNNRFLAVRELEIAGLRTPNYNRRADLVCFANGLPLVNSIRRGAGVARHRLQRIRLRLRGPPSSACLHGCQHNGPMHLTQRQTPHGHRSAALALGRRAYAQAGDLARCRR